MSSDREAERRAEDPAPAPDREPAPDAEQAPSLPDDDLALQAGFCGAEPEPPPPPPPPPPVVDVEELNWERIGADAGREAAAVIRARAPETVRRLEALLDAASPPGLMFDADRDSADDRAIVVKSLQPDTPLWFVGDLHGDLLGLETALAHARADGGRPRLVFLGDLFDDGGCGLEVLLRFYELVLDAPDAVCLVVGNHDEGLGWDGARFTATVSPADFTEFLNARLDDETVVRAGQLAVRLFATAPRALFFPDGLLVAHGGFPHTDLHAELEERGDWNDPRCLEDFVWLRAHPKARKKIPNRTTRGAQFGREDFAAFCALSARMGRPVSRMVRGHDHIEERYLLYPAYEPHPLVTINTMSRRLPREMFGPHERVPCIARWLSGLPPQVHRLHVPPELVRAIFPPAQSADAEAAVAAVAPAAPSAPNAAVLGAEAAAEAVPPGETSTAPELDVPAVDALAADPPAVSATDATAAGSPEDSPASPSSAPPDETGGRP